MFLQQNQLYFRDLLYCNSMIFDSFRVEKQKLCLLDSLGDTFSKLLETLKRLRRRTKNMWFFVKTPKKLAFWGNTNFGAPSNQGEKFTFSDLRINFARKLKNLILHCWRERKSEKKHVFSQNFSTLKLNFSKIWEILAKSYSSKMCPKFWGVPFSLPLVRTCRL